MGKTSEAATDEHIDAWQDDLTALKFDKKLVDVAIDDLRNDKDLTLDEAAKKLNSYFNQVDNGQIDYDDQVALSQKEDENGDGFITANMENTTLAPVGEDGEGAVGEEETDIFIDFFSKEGWKDYEQDPDGFKEDLLDYLAEIMDTSSPEYQEIEDFIDNPDTSYALMATLFEHIAGDDDILTQSDLDNFEAGTLLADGPDGEKTISAYLRYQDYLDTGLPQKEIERRLKLEPGEKPEPGDPLPIFTEEEREERRREDNEKTIERIKQLLDFGRELLEDGGEDALDASDRLVMQIGSPIGRFFVGHEKAAQKVNDFMKDADIEKVLAFFDDLQTLSGTDELELEDFDVLKDGNFNIDDDGSILLGA